MPERSSPSDRYGRVLVAVAALGAAGAALASALSASGRFLFPLDDAYIYLQYAVRAAEGHPFSYGPGEPASTGMTSLLYPALLALPARMGLRGDALALFAFGLGAFFLAGSGLLVHRLVGRSCRRSVALASALLVVLTGPCLWGVLSGMEIGMTLFLFLLCAEAYLREREAGKLRFSPFLLFLLCFSRPEAMAWALGFSALSLAWTRRGSLAGRRLLILPFLAPVLLVALNVALMGRPGPDTARLKSPLYTPEYSPLFHARTAGRFLASVGEGLVTGSFVPRGAPGLAAGETLVFLPPLALLFAGAALAPGLREEIRARSPGPVLLLGGWFLGGLLAVAFLSGASTHHFRYLLPYLAGLVALLIPCVDALAGRLARRVPGIRRGVLFGLAAAALLLWQLRTCVDFVERYGREGRGLAEYREAARFMRENVRPSDRTAILDAGIVGYFSGRRLVDLYGLTTASMAPSSVFWADWAGSKYEVMAGWPPSERPRYFLAHRVRWDENGDEAHLDPFRTRAVRTFPGPPPGVPTVGRALTLWEIDWTRLAPAPAPCGAAGTVRDALNVADVASERAHAFRAPAREPGTFTSNRVLSLACGGGVAADGVRGVDGSAEFTLHSPGGPARLVLRAVGPPGAVRVDVNGAPAGVVALEGAPGRWEEPALRIPSAEQPEVRVRLAGRFLLGHAWLVSDAP